MLFVRKLRDRIRSGEITCTVRLWQRLHVRVGGRYARLTFRYAPRRAQAAVKRSHRSG